MAFTFVEIDEEAVPLHVNQYGDALSGTPGQGQAILLTALNNSGQYALSVRNQDTANGRTADFQKPDGSASWFVIDVEGNHALGLILVQQVTPTAPGSGESIVYAGTDSELYVIHGSGTRKKINEQNPARSFLLMGA
jgi:hypothetical protein